MLVSFTQKTRKTTPYKECNAIAIGCQECYNFTGGELASFVGDIDKKLIAACALLIEGFPF